MEPRYYLDTSIFGGYFDKEFAKWTKPLIDQIREGKTKAVISDLTIQEIEPAPDFVQELLEEIIKGNSELVYGNQPSKELADTYLKEGALTQKSIVDAHHIALATIENITAMVVGTLNTS